MVIASYIIILNLTRIILKFNSCVQLIFIQRGTLVKISMIFNGKKIGTFKTDEVYFFYLEIEGLNSCDK